MSRIRVPKGETVRFPDGTSISATYGATATQWTNERPAAADRDESSDFGAALVDQGFVVSQTIHVELDPADVRGFRLSEASVSRDHVVLRTPPAPPGMQTVVLYHDESGGLSWHFDARSDPASGARFEIPTRTSAASASLRAGLPQPGRLLTLLGRKVLKVLQLPRLPAGESAVPDLVAPTEQRSCPSRLRELGPNDYRRAEATQITNWSRFRGKRSLLFLHDWLGSSHEMLSQLPLRTMQGWHERYGGRVLGYDHLTLCRTPDENARDLLTLLQDTGGELELDVVCHGRGGLVARALVERGAQLVPFDPAHFANVYFVATPNQGTSLADPKHIVPWLDVFTNWSANSATGPAQQTLGPLLSVVKLAASGEAVELPGVTAMGTRGYLESLNRGSAGAASYAAAASEYVPAHGRESASFLPMQGSVLDAVFAEGARAVPNDLVVPAQSVHGGNGHPSFPIEAPVLFDADEHVSHFDFFSNAKLLEDVERHLFNQPAAPKAAPRTSVTMRGTLRNKRSRGAAKKGGGAEKEAARKRTAGRGGDHLARDPQIDFPDRVEAGVANELLVSLLEPPAGATAALAIAIARNADEVALTVSISAPGFEVEVPGNKGAFKSGREQQMTVGRTYSAENERVVFRLTALASDEPIQRVVRADFYQGNSCLGSASHETLVSPKGKSAARRSGKKPPGRLEFPLKPRQDCDLAIHVEGKNSPDQSPFKIWLSSRIPGEEYQGRKGGELRAPGKGLAEFLRDVVTPQIKAYPGTASEQQLQKWQADFSAELDEFGRHLWTLLPSELQSEYFRLWKAGAAPRSILVYSEEAVFPWELVIPHVVIDGKLVVLKPLGTEHILGRWPPGLGLRPTPQRLDVEEFCVINPDYPGADALPWSVAEAQALKDRFSWIERIEPADLPTVHQKILNRDKLQLLHFTGHGDYHPRNANLNHLLLEDGGQLKATAIAGTSLGGVAHPIVYLNACSVGVGGVVAGHMGGFASLWLKDGCSGVIAPYWPIRDSKAAEFAQALYDKLDGERPIGVALQELRRDAPDDPTIRSYAYFGDPWTRTIFR